MLIKEKIIKAFLVLIFCFFVNGLTAEAQTYVPMEPIPGTHIMQQIDFPGYVDALYKFVIWTSGIAALLMINIGGFMYFTAAGNTSKLEKAKGVISDALLGLIAIMTAYLILYIINPDLVQIDLEMPDF